MVSFKNFAKITTQYHGYFWNILNLSAEDLYQTLNALQKFNIDNLINFFRSDYFGRANKYPIKEQSDKEIFFNFTL